ncbi:unnamed protein product [Owenia fusiformis]|uniref:POU domain protein n=1 Tax=Owenia fusiformis TaxID=6347 RepID=A0A8J1TIC1_OWEFU|nr:unnamed protein product [Owenia fusiformis]
MMDTMSRNSMSYSGLYHPQGMQTNMFGGFDDGYMRNDPIQPTDHLNKRPSPMPQKTDTVYVEMTSLSPSASSRTQIMHPPPPPPLYGFGAEGHMNMMDQMSTASTIPLSNDHHILTSHPVSQPQMSMPSMSAMSGMTSMPSVYGHGSYGIQHPSPPGVPHLPPGHPINYTMHELDCDPRELEAFAERFKQRRIKLGVTQADVGNALAKLKLPGVGSLSQSTICRFESLTLSHNNMIALKPVLAAWLEEAEAAAREKKMLGDGQGKNGDSKRKRTSIGDSEKRSLEAYFQIQPRPSGEKISQIADKLDLKKSVVRVWFCNQRQKQKRMKFAANN